MRAARYWSRPAKPVVGMAGCCWAAEVAATSSVDTSALRRRRSLHDMLFLAAQNTKGGSPSSCARPGRVEDPSPHGYYRLHAVIVRAAAALGRHPGDDLVRISNVAGLAVDAIRRVQADALAVGLSGVVHHFVNIRRAEILARVAEFLHAASIADIGLVNDQVRWLVLFVLGAGVIEVGELVESQLAVAFRGAEEMGVVAALGRQFGEFLEVLISRGRVIAVVQTAATAELLQASVDHAAPESVLEALMKVADLPEFALDPA